MGKGKKEEPSTPSSVRGNEGIREEGGRAKSISRECCLGGLTRKKGKGEEGSFFQGTY